MKDRIKTLNEIVAIPEDCKVMTSDGRVFSIVSWVADVDVHRAPQVTCIMISEDKCAIRKNG